VNLLFVKQTFKSFLFFLRIWIFIVRLAVSSKPSSQPIWLKVLTHCNLTISMKVLKGGLQMCKSTEALYILSSTKQAGSCPLPKRMCSFRCLQLQETTRLSSTQPFASRGFGCKLDASA